MIGRVALVGIIITLLGMGTLHLFHETVRFRHRNFYGIYRIVDDLSFDKKFEDTRKLVHGKRCTEPKCLIRPPKGCQSRIIIRVADSRMFMTQPQGPFELL